MRIARGNRLGTVWQHVRLFIMIAITAAASLGLHNALVPTAAAEGEQQPVEEQPVPTEPQQTLLQTGLAQSMTPNETKPTDTLLRWTPTGIGDVQDTYDINVAADPTVDPLTGALTTDIRLQATGLLTSEFDARSLPEGTYYWQVRSCATQLTCKAWTQVWTIRVDATAPAEPTAQFTSDDYVQTVSFAGTAEANSTVIVLVNDKTCIATAAEDGAWSCTFEDDFDFGDYTASLKATDKAGNDSPLVNLDFSVKELFVAPVIAPEDLPPVLDIIPVDETPENKVFQQQETAAIDVVNTAADMPTDIATTPAPLSTDGGIVQTSENGWQILGLPWFLWVGSATGIAGAFWAFGVPFPRRLGSILSL